MLEQGSDEQIAQLGKVDDEIDQRNTAIKLYLTRINQNLLSDHESWRCREMTTFTIRLEQIGDIIEKNLLVAAQKKRKSKLDFSKPGWTELVELHTHVVDNMQLALNVFISGDLDSARQLILEKEHLRDLELESSAQHLERLCAGQVASIETSALHLDILRDLKQVNSHITSVAYPILLESGELLNSRLKHP
jgi:phosphate:Na+ symporter